MGVYKVKLVESIFRYLTTLTACRADGDGTAVIEPPVIPVAESALSDIAAGDKPAGKAPEPKKENKPPVIENPLENYVGSKEVNPEQRPLKKIDRKAFGSKAEMDRFIQEAGKELLMSDEDIASDKKAAEEIAKKEKTPGDKKTVDGKEGKPGKRDEGGKFKKGETVEDNSEEDATKAFFETTGIDEKEFAKLPEKIQEKLVEGYSKGFEATGKTGEIEKQHGELKTQVTNLVKDAVIAARLEEIATGKSFVAKDLPVPTGIEIENLMEAAGDKAGFQRALVEFMSKKAGDVIAVERSVIESKARREKLESEAMAVVNEMVALEKRIGITEKDIKNVDEKHAEYEAWKGENGLFNFFKKHRLSLSQIKEIGSEKLLTLLAKDRGWDKERDKKVYAQGAKALLAKIKEAAGKARTLDMGKMSASPEAENNQRGYDRNSLVSEVAAGSLNNWERLLEQADQRGDKKMISALTAIREQAMYQRKKQHTPSD